ARAWRGRSTSSLNRPAPTMRRASSLRRTGSPIPVFIVLFIASCARPQRFDYLPWRRGITTAAQIAIRGEHPMDLPRTNYDVPFDITRSSHVVLTVKDLEASRLFYTEVIGLVVTEQERDTLYLRGVEEACHHSLVLRRTSSEPMALRIGMRVLR